MNINQLRKIILETVAEEQSKNRFTKHELKLRESLRRAKLLLEDADDTAQGEAQQSSQPAGNASALDGVGPKDNLADFNGIDVAASLYNTQEPLSGAQVAAAAKWDQAPKTAAEFGALARKELGSPEEFAAKYDKIKEMIKSFGGRGYHKAFMPALEGGDAARVADALDDSAGIGVDVDKSGDDFDTFWNASGDEYEGKTAADILAAEKEKKPEDQKNLQASKYIDPDDLIVEFKDAHYPFPGAEKVMDGAPNKGDKGAPASDSEITGKAAAFLTKGVRDGRGNDNVALTPNASGTGSSLKPTQTNIQIGKSLMFALTDVFGNGGDMGGAYATKDGDILDGHHRWSGGYLRDGESRAYTNINQIEAPFSQDLLKLLTVVGNALGRPTKAADPNDPKKMESATKSGDTLVMERWKKLAGLLKD